MTEPPLTQAQRTREAIIAALVIGVLTLFFALVNWHWLRANVVTYGWDRMDHLITSLVYNDIWRNWSASSFYAALSYSDYYPPLVHWGVLALYRIFGVNEDVAVMINVLYMALLLAATWSIARRVTTLAGAMLATVLLGVFPMIFQMSRYLYLDFALTALVAVSIALLLATERFERRGYSLLFGVALAAAFWVKWTTASFLATPLLFVLWRANVFGQLLRYGARLRPAWGKLLLMLAISAGLNLLWLYPARTAVAQHPLGWGLLPIFTLLMAGALYAIVMARPAADSPSRNLQHALGAGAVAAWLMGLWYITNPEFLIVFTYTAYGREDGRFWAYGKYLYEVTTEQIGPFLSACFVLVVLVWLAQRRRDWRRWFGVRDETAWLLLIWVVAAYVIFSTRVSLAHSRYVMPFLPPFAIWMAAGLVQWRPPWLRKSAIAALLIGAGLQFALVSFESLATWRPAFTVNMAGQTYNLLPHGFFIQFAASGNTDPGYAIAPDVLDIAETTRQASGRDVVNLGLLVNSYQLHEKHFLYAIYTDFPQVRLRELARNWREQPAYNQLFDMDLVLVNDTHSFRTDDDSQRVAERIFTHPNDLFNLAFRPVHDWTLPNGEHLVLFGRRFAPVEPGVATEDYLAVLTSFADRLGAGDAVVLTSPDQAYMMGLSLPETVPATLVPLPADGATAQDAMRTLADLAATHKRIFVISHNAELVDPDAHMATWLAANTVMGADVWAGSIRVTPFIPVATTPPTKLTAAAAWPDGLELSDADQLALRQGDGVEPGGALVVSLAWKNRPASAHKASLQLLAADGTLVAQHDRDIDADQQRYVMLLPRSLSPGDYTLFLTVYDPTTLQRFATSDGVEQLHLTVVTVHQASGE